MNVQAEALLLKAYHRGRIAEVNEGNRRAADSLIEAGYAETWRTLLGYEAIRLTERGCVKVRNIEAER